MPTLDLQHRIFGPDKAPGRVSNQTAAQSGAQLMDIPWTHYWNEDDDPHTHAETEEARIARVADDLLVRRVQAILDAGVSHMDPPYDTRDLDTPYMRESPAGWPKDDDLPVAIAKQLGPEYSTADLEDGVGEYYDNDEIRRFVKHARAWPLLTLEPSLFTSPSHPAIRDNLIHHIQSLTGLPFVLPARGGYGGIGIYGHIHTEAAMVLRESAPNVLFLEIYGQLVGAAGKAIGDPAYLSHVVQRRVNLGKLTILDGPMVFHITRATLSNISFPGIRVGYYE